MKKQLFAVFALIAAAFAFSSPRIDAKPDGDSVIIITPGNNLGTPVPNRSSVPIGGSVSEGIIYLSFSDNLGVIAVELSESVNGLILQTVVDSSYLSAAIPFVGAPGEYYITFTLTSGAEYIGTFVIY